MKASCFAFARIIFTMHSSFLVVTLLCGSAHAQILNPANGHYYEFVDQALTWDEARLAAESRTFAGVNGYLATITSQVENDFLSSYPSLPTIGGGWLGGFQPAGSVEPAGGWSWITGEPFVFTNWDEFEPNNGFGDNPNENALNFGFSSGQWNDAPNIFTGPFFVEYNVPEPGSLALSALGLLVFLACRAKRRSAAL